MNRLVLTRSNSGKYSIVDNNDEKLFILISTLIDNNLRDKIKDLLNNLDSLKDQYHLLSEKADTNKFYFLKETSDFVLIRVHNEKEPLSESNPKQIDVNLETYLDLIENWEDITSSEPIQIFVKRVEDDYLITSDPADL